MTREDAKNWLNKLYAMADFTDEYGDMEDMQPYEEALDMAIQALEPDPCDFCSTIYPDADTKNIVFGRGKYSDVHVESFITIDDEGKYHVNIDPGDPYELGYLVDIKFCPYCGRKLSESEE